MIAIYDKIERCFKVFTDLTAAGLYCGVHASTIGRRLPYYEDSRFIIGILERVKSNRGFKN